MRKTLPLLAILALSFSTGISQKRSDEFIADSLRANNIFLEGRTFFDSAKYDLALSKYLEALEIATPTFGELHNSTGNLVFNTGTMYFFLGDYWTAEKYYNRAAFIRKSLFGDNSPLLAQVYSNMGAVYNRMRRFGKAAQSIEKAIAIAIANGGEDSETLDFPYNNLGTTYFELDDYPKAILYQYKAMKIRQRKLEQPDAYIGMNYFNIGNALQGQQKYDEALEAYAKADTIFSNTLHPNNEQFAYLYNSIGVVLQKKKEYEKALEYKGRAMKVYEALGALFHPATTHTRLSMGIDHWEMGKKEEAIRIFNELIDTFSLMLGSDYYVLLDAYNFNAEYLLEQNKPQEALNYLGKIGLGKLQSNEDRNEMLSELSRLSLTEAKAYFQLYKSLSNHTDLLTAEQKFGWVIRLLDTQMAEFSFDGKKLGLDIRTEASEYLLKCKLLKGGTHSQEAFKISEQAKGNLLYQMLLKSNALVSSGIPDSLIQQFNFLKREIDDLKIQLSSNPNLLESEKLQLQTDIFDNAQKLEKLESSLGDQYPSYLNLQYNNETLPHEKVGALLHPHQTLLEYFVGDSSIFLFVIKKDLYHVEEIKKDFPLETWVDNLRSLTFRISEKPYAFIETATSLYDKLLRPVEHLLTDTSLVIIPDGVLGYLSFEALIASAPKTAEKYSGLPYLLHRYAISYCYSATLLQLMQEKKHKQAPSGELLAFAPWPGEGHSSTKRGGISNPDDLPPLSASTVEVDFISNLLKGQALHGKTATKARFLALANQYRILHLALHGQADNRMGDYSWLAFYNSHNGLDSILLYVRELYNTQLNADLVVLSACETSYGELLRGEGIISLARAFSYAGAKSIVSTLWSVNDASTMEIMQDFYTNLHSSRLPKDEALRQAKLAFLKKHPRQAQPFYWAGVIPVGDITRLW